ncbi:hypothetical protein PUN28_011955 [Cardiocondyla obscurior]|uniref:RPGRIP1 C-terminal domain-containing protein n=1 Tax=Cardiocondyla obscurior TaxID=286306 RepID=A0AAW2FBX3_9HYME
MADDPNRDIVPVREGSYADTTVSAIDLRERHLVCKLDRCQLEDKYLRLLDEASNLKKLCNCQEDKIKRLGTKLIRLAGNPRCGFTLDVADDKNRTTALELENAKLKEKITVMRNQLLSHTMSGRSSSRNRNLVRPSSSGFVTCRSENNRIRAPSCQCIVGARDDDDNDTRNYLVKIEKLEAQKKEMTCHIIELEKELAHLTNNQKEKVAENVEYIRVWRQMKQLNDKLMITQEKNVTLTTEINDLKTTLEQTTRNSQEIAAVLSSERTRMAEIDDQMLKAKNSQFSLREKDERIRDLTSEIKILQQHNNELIALTSKYGQVELENMELKKKLCDDTQKQQTLKNAFNQEQANIIALKTTNEQLFAKLEELQANIDTLTMQLTSLHTQDKKSDSTIPTPSCKEKCKKCCEMYDKILQLEKTVSNTRENWQSADKSVQTVNAINTREQGTMIILNNEDKTPLQSPLKEWKTEISNTSVLSREKILKLLDQAQINTPLDASRITPKEEYAGILDVTQRHSDHGMPSQCDASNIVQKSSQKKLSYLANLTREEMLLMLYDILQEILLLNEVDKKPTMTHQVSAIGDSLTDINNNNPTITVRDVKQHAFSTESIEDCESDCCYTSCSLQSTDTFSQNYDLVCKKKSTTLTREVSSPVKDTFDATSFSGIQKKLCYRDISKDFCAEKTIKRLKPPHYTKCDVICHLRKTTEPQLIQKYKLPCKISCLNDSEKLPMLPMESSPLLINDKQGLIEIHISRLQLSTSVAKIPDEEDVSNLRIYISWDVWNEKTAYTPKMKCPNLIFNTSSVYRIVDLFSFFKNVLLEYLIFRVNVVRPADTSYLLAIAKVSIKNILDYPQNKLHYIVPVNSVICSLSGVSFGQLSLWMRLSCNIDMVEAFKKQYCINSMKNILHAPPIKKEKEEDENGRVETKEEREVKDENENEDEEDEEIIPNKYRRRTTYALQNIVSFKKQKEEDGLESKDLASPKIRLPSYSNFNSDIENSNNENYNNSSNDKSSSSITETNKKLEKNRTVVMKNLDSRADNIEKRECNNPSMDSSSMAEFRTLLANCHRKEDNAIVIEIVSMQLFSGSRVMQDDEARLLYVEYSFLGNYGEDMETVSVVKPKTSDKEMVYNYKKKFWIDEVTHPIQRDNLRAMLAETICPDVKFTVLCEPLPEEREDKDCEEVGYAIFNIKKYALGDECKYIFLPINDDQEKQIGILKIVVSGLNAIRLCLPKLK